MRPKGNFRAGRYLRQQPLLALSLAVIGGWLLVALLAGIVAPYDPLAINVNNRLQPPGLAHLWGTDELGRDNFSRVLYGSRITIPAALVLIALGSLIGIAVGIIAGFLGGLWDFILMRLTELFMGFPAIILAMAAAAALGPDIINEIIALAVVWWPGYARMMRARVLQARTEGYVEAAYSVGAPAHYILWRTILPNCAPSAIVLVTLDSGNAVLAFAGLSFLGLGPEPTSPEWGRMVAAGIDFFDQWWTWAFPSIAISSLVLALNFVGDNLRDLLDPRLRGALPVTATYQEKPEPGGQTSS